ncbi:MAG: mechanosensitive ion channel family protein [Gammaproteobacteria bacterium]|nr:mechanosensitive ion channel family protein [Gammaproteobacteria bacterium]
MIEAGRELAPVVGPWISQEALPGVRWITVLASMIVLAAVILAHVFLRRVIHRKICDDRASAEGAPSDESERHRWLGRGLKASLPPLALLIWVAGVYAAIAFALRDLEYHDTGQTVLRVLDFVASAGMLAGLFWLIYRVTRVLEKRANTVSESADSSWDRVVFPHAAKTVRRTLPLVVLILGIPLIPVSGEMEPLAGKAVSLLVIGAVALVLFQIVQAVEELILARHEADPADRFRVRKIRTQVTVLKKIVAVIIGVFTLASMLMVFESVRQFGTSILASAGIAGIVIGLAAQRSIATLLAGFQVALTRPIRIDDVVVVENEWGRIEDITLTFVILCVWDQRRLIVPISYFMERPFQNWTSTSSDILGTVFLHVDYTMPIEPLRQELDRILSRSQYWDGKLRSILVTDAKEHTLEVRAMATAADGDQAWFLRCEIREKLVEFIRKNYPESLPRLRAELQGPEREKVSGTFSSA